MRISSMMQERVHELEERKRIQQRRDAGDAYRKNSQYFSFDKSPALKELEQLLTGEKDYSQYEEQKDEKPEVKAAIRELQQTEQNVRAHEQAHMSVGGAVAGSASFTYAEGPDGKRYVTGGEVPINPPAASSTEDTIAILEQVKRAALAPADPSPQDLRVAASVTAQLQQVKAQKVKGDETSSETEDQVESIEPAFVNEKLEVSVPERFNKELNLNAQKETVFGKSYEELYKSRLFNKAKEYYTAHTEMVKNGYRLGNEPQFSLIA